MSLGVDLVFIPLLLVCVLVPSCSTFEAAFQGECKEDSPCQQLCFDLHDGTFECGCKEGFLLLDNGYSCIVRDGEWRGPPTTSSPKFVATHTSSDDYYSDEIEDSSSVPSYPLTISDLPYHRTDKALFRRRNAEEDRNATTDWTAIRWKLSRKTKDLNSRNCKQKPCDPGSVCLQTLSLEGTVCRCQYGRKGSNCQKLEDIQVPYFLGSYSFLSVPLKEPTNKGLQVVIEFRPESTEGVLLYGSQTKGLTGDFSALILQNGFIIFRYECGNKQGSLRSYQPVIFGAWNTLTVYRDRRDVWMQLNSGRQVHHHLSGFSFKMRLGKEVYVGGFVNKTVLNQRLDIRQGYRGCVRYLEMNGQVYKFSVRDVSHGLGVEECPLDECSAITCLNGGMCVSDRSGVRCACPPEVTGVFCETVFQIVVPSFSGQSYVQYSPMDSSSLNFLEILLVFKPFQPDGLLLYSGNKSGDFILLNLVQGFLEFTYNLGSGIGIVRSWEPLKLEEWHRVFISRTGRYSILLVDSQRPSEGYSPGGFTQLYLPLSLFLGGLPTFWRVPVDSSIMRNFVGCIQKLVINNQPVKLMGDAVSAENVQSCEHPCKENPCFNRGQCLANLDYYLCHCGLGHAGPNCEKPVTEMIANPMFSGSSYLHYTQPDILKRLEGNRFDLQLQFRSFAPDGIILWTGSKDADFFLIVLHEGLIRVRYNLGSGEAGLTYNSTYKLDNGVWHSLIISRTNQQTSVKINEGPQISCQSPGPHSQLNTQNGLFLGGREEVTTSYGYTGLVGCLGNLTLSSNYHLRLLTEAAAGVNVQPCV